MIASGALHGANALVVDADASPLPSRPSAVNWDAVPSLDGRQSPGLRLWIYPNIDVLKADADTTPP